MSKKQDFEKEKEWFFNNWDWVINGSYGQEYHDNYKSQYKEAQSMTAGRKAQALRRIVINGFTTLVAKELACSYSYAQKLIVNNTVSAKELELQTEAFVKELPDILG